jgi:hypothetical protein
MIRADSLLSHLLSLLLSFLLLLLCGAGILVAWVPGSFLWHCFECLVFGLTLVWLVAWSVGKLEARWSWQLVPFLGIILLGCIQLLEAWTVYRFATQEDLLRWAAYLAIFFLASQLFGNAAAFRGVFLTYALVVAVVSVLQWFAGNGRIFWLFDTQEPARLGPFLNHDHYASFISLALPMSLFESVRRPDRWWVYSVIGAALYASAIAGGSRAGFVLMTAEIFLMFVLIRFPGRIVMAELGLILVFGTIVGWGYLYGRFNIHDPYSGRREVASATVTMIKASPVHGYGLGTWTDVYPAFAEKDFGVFINAAHNDWLQWGADGGIPMVGCMLLLFAGSLAALRRAPWALGVPIVFVHGLIDFPMQGKFLPAVVFLVFGIAVSSANRSRDLPCA